MLISSLGRMVRTLHGAVLAAACGFLVAGCAQTACALSGGRYVHGLGSGHCQKPSTDVGRPCRSRADCQAACGCSLDEIANVPAGRLVGHCTEYPPAPGEQRCVVENGTALPLIAD